MTKPITHRPLKTVGRKTTYRAKICKQIIDHFSRPPYEIIEIPHYKNGELAWTDQKRVPAPIPSLSAFCVEYDWCWSTCKNWLNEQHASYKPMFLATYRRVRALRQDWLMNCAISGGIAPNTFKFIAVNLTDMRDKTEIEHKQVDDFSEIVRKAEEARKLRRRAKTVISTEVQANEAIETHRALKAAQDAGQTCQYGSVAGRVALKAAKAAEVFLAKEGAKNE